MAARPQDGARDGVLRRRQQNAQRDDVHAGEERPDKPVHKGEESLFSSSSGFLNYRGILNDCILLLVLSNFKNVVTNLLNYGLLVDPRKWIGGMIHLSGSPCAGLTILCGVFPIVALLLEKLAVKGHISERNLFICHFINLAVELFFPVLFVVYLQCGPLGSFIALSLYTITFMKLISYAQVNLWCRRAYRNKTGGPQKNNKNNGLVQYPDNLTFTDMAYFVLAPTLCYELNFPRTPKIRVVFVIRRICEAVFLFNVVLALAQQWLVPTIMGSLVPFKNWDFPRIIERHLTLAVPSHVLWLMSFYWLFHSVLNLLAELLRFGDRCFYKDWWNAESIARFWKTWNVPVHRWCSRHLYDPMVEHGYSRLTAQISAFLFSAFFHEYLCSIPLLMVRPWAFGAMLAQIPLAYLTSFSFMQGQPGNVLVWASIVLGQPLAVLMYMVEYYLNNMPPAAAANVTVT